MIVEKNLKRFCQLAFMKNKFRGGWLVLLFFLFFLPVQKADGIEVVNNLNFDFYSQEHGLSNNQIHCILQDKKGWMWFGTSQGVCRFDGFHFTVFKNDPEDSASLKGNLVRAIFEDHKGQLWIGTENGGLNKFNREKENFQHYFYHEDHAVLKDASVTSIHEDVSENLWVGTETNLYRIENEKKLIEIKPSNISGFSNYFRVIRSDPSGRIWVGTNNGLFVYNPKNNLAEKVILPQSSSTNQEIWEIVFDDDGTVWTGTYASGMYTVNPASLEARHLVIDPNNDRSNTVRSISKDRNGKYWIGTRGGLYIYEKNKGVTAFYYHEEREPKSLVNNSVQCIVHDLKGDVWIGTRNGINFLIEERQNILGFKSMPGDDRYLNSSEIYAFWIDPKGDVWAGTESGGINILNRKTGRFKYLVPQKGNPNSLSRNCIKALLDDGKGNLWIGTFLGGIDVLNLKTGNYKHYRNDPADPTSLSENRVWSLLRDSNNDIWAGTSNGLDKFDPVTGTFIHFKNLADGQQVNWLVEDSDHCLWIGADELIIYNPKDQKITRVNESTRYMLQDSKKRFWLTTSNRGVALYSKEKGVLKYYTEKNGLANNQTLAILEDDEHFLWISTTNGLSKFDPEKERFHNFSLKNGFQNNQFTYGAAYKTNGGELLFGGISGFNIFNPTKIKSGEYFAPIVLTDFKIFNKSIRIGNRKSDVLTKCISETDQVKLKYDQNSITLEFTSFDYANSLGIQFSYYLENFDKDWNEPSENRSATYTNLDPGEYTFRVKTVSIDRQESNPGPELKIIVLPPYWERWWFRALTFVTIFGLFYLLITFLLNREKLKNDLVFERIKAKKLHELDMMKLRFYTNISHEIRTPLTLILGPLEKMRNNSIPGPEIKGHVELMHRNATQLHQLINQLLDFRKLETGNLKLVLSRGDLVSYISGIVGSFDEYAEEKEIELKFTSLKKEIITDFDADKVSKIMNNLLSNAFKFTGKGGKISVNLSLVFDSDENELVDTPDKRMIEISVKDTGIGIADSNLEKIFNRFFQVGEGGTQTGTGIGLALTKELVKLHNGKIFVSSKPGKGSKFTVQLPFVEFPTIVSTELIHSSEKNENEKEQVVPIIDEHFGEQFIAGQKIMLLVDDNSDVRYFIKSHFSASYQVLEAGNGLEGWNIALKTIPDIIISDIMMPDMDGFEFCRKVRKDERTSHIPILLLTALGSREHEIEGLSYGADDYITKPFDLVILQTKVENILSVRQSLKQKYAGEMLLQPKNIKISSPDERFLQKAIEVVENNIADPDLDIERFASEIGVSRMQLYRKLNALTEMTVKEFVRNIRLKRAAQMLVQKKLNVSEVAYAVGFKDLSHFRKCFRQEFGMSSSEYIEKHQAE
jgi:signal transduction histidine kinase/ligand-binding sensor domain-containing protein/DNA-binding response OmpR family regulator